MPKRKYYAVLEGRLPGIYKDWSACEAQVKGVKRAKFKSFVSYQDAEAYMRTGSACSATYDVISNALEKGITVAYTDGSCVNGVGGIGVYFGESDSRNLSETIHDKHCTNQRAEVLAGIRALEIVSKDKPLCVYSDSSYLVDSINKNWKCRKNQDLFERLHSLISARSIKPEWIHVPGHAGNHGNDAADALARAAATKNSDM